MAVNSFTSSTCSSASAVALTTFAVVRQHGLDGCDELVLGDALVRRDRDRVVGALAIEELLRRRDREHREARVPEAVEAAVLRDPDELERALRLQGRDLDLVTDRVALVVRGAHVDDDLVGRRWPTALEDVERIELVERRRSCRCRIRTSARPRS